MSTAFNAKKSSPPPETHGNQIRLNLTLSTVILSLRAGMTQVAKMTVTRRSLIFQVFQATLPLPQTGEIRSVVTLVIGKAVLIQRKVSFWVDLSSLLSKLSQFHRSDKADRRLNWMLWGFITGSSFLKLKKKGRIKLSKTQRTKSSRLWSLEQLTNSFRKSLKRLGRKNWNENRHKLRSECRLNCHQWHQQVVLEKPLLRLLCNHPINLHFKKLANYSSAKTKPQRTESEQ